MKEHIRESNLIEGIDSEEEDKRSLRTWNWAVGNKDTAFTSGNLLEIHRRITLKQLSKYERGSWRRVQVYVGSHTPPAPALIVSQISQYLDSMRYDWKTLDPKTMHIEFERIHPFVDGNGRTGRMLMWIHELKLGREPTLLKASERQEYYKWFKEQKG